VLCFLLVCPATDKENTPVFNQQNIETAHKLQDDENDIEKEENPYFGGLISGQRADCIERETPEIKIPLLKICDDGNAIDDNFVVSLGLASFFSKYGSYLTSKTKTAIDLSSYSRFEITDWLFEIGKISFKEKMGLYKSFFSNAFFENEHCLTRIYEEYTKETSNTYLGDVNRPFSSQAMTGSNVYSTSHFDVNYYPSEFVTDNIPSQIGQRFELIRAFFVNEGYPVPNNQSGYGRYQINIFHNPGNSGEAGLTIFDGVPYPNTTSWINLYYVSYTELDSKFNEVAAHEWYHALRSQYYSGISWFDESFANWAGIIYDGDSEFANGSIIDFINSDVSLDNDSYKYGACLFPLVLYKDYGGHSFIKRLLTTYGSVIANHPSYQGTQGFISAINQALISGGYNDTFDTALRNMHSYDYLPNSWYNDAVSTTTTRYWVNNDKTTNNLLLSDGTAENAAEGTRTYSNIDVKRLGRKYFQLLPMNGKAYNVEFEVTFNGGSGFAQHHESEPGGAIYIGPLNNINNATSWHFYGLGSRYNDAGIILTNTSPTSNSTCTITIHYQTIRENYIFKLSDRLFQRRFYLDSNEYAEYIIQFANEGRKIIQTFGPSDKKIELFTTGGSPLNNPYQDDDKGYGLNGFSIHDCYSNEILKIKVHFYSSSESGFIKLVITNSSGVTDSTSGIQRFTDITEIVHDNFYLGTWCNQYKSTMLRYRPSASGTVQITLSSVFDNYLYLIDPTSNSLNQQSIDFDDDSGNGANASITRFLSSSHDYLIVYVQFDPSTNFVNLNEGDDLTIHFERISS